MFNIAVCDDEKYTCRQIEAAMSNWLEKNIVEISNYYSAKDLYEELEQGNHYDLIFLNIEFKSMSGIEMGKKIRNELKNESIQIVFISEKQEYAMELFNIRPLNFLIKPVRSEDIVNNVEKVMKLMHNNQMYFEFQIRKECFRILYDEIMYFESNNRKIKVHMKYEVKEIYEQLKHIEEKIPSSFVRIHQSFLVNRIYVSGWNSNEIILVNAEKLPISKSYRKNIKNLFF